MAFSTLPGGRGKSSAQQLGLSPKIRGGFKNEECKTGIFFYPGLSGFRDSSMVRTTSHDSRHRDANIVKQPGRCATTIRIRKDCFGGEEFLHSHRGTIADFHGKPQSTAGPSTQDHDLPNRQEYD